MMPNILHNPYLPYEPYADGLCAPFLHRVGGFGQSPRVDWGLVGRLGSRNAACDLASCDPTRRLPTGVGGFRRPVPCGTGS